MTATSGPTSPEPFATYDPASSCWRTCQATFHWGSDEYSAIWPKRGSTRTGHAYERPTSVPAIAVSDCSWLPTPTSRDHKGRNQRNDARCLIGALLPTPNAGQYNYDEDPAAWQARRDLHASKEHNPTRSGLPLAVALKMLPTPTATDQTGSRRATARTAEWTSHPGTTLTDWAWTSGTTSPPSTAGPASSDDQRLPGL